MRDRRVPGAQSESGAVMILALGFIIVVGIVAAAVLLMAYTGSNTLAVYRQDRIVRANAEAAMTTTIVRLSKNPLMATDGTSTGTPSLDSSCALNYPMQQPTTGGVIPTFTSGSVLQVTCGPTSAYNASGPWGAGSGSGHIDTASGTQGPRDVTITVTCKVPTANADAKSKVTCGTSGTSRVVARARVRFEIDYTKTNKLQWAVVPKVIAWDLRR